ASVSRPRAGDPHPRRDHGRAVGAAAPRGCALPRGAPRGRPGRSDLATRSGVLHCVSGAIGRACAVLLPGRTVGVMGDGRTYDHACALRAVTSTDGMTADVYPFDAAFVTRVAGRIVNEVRGINRVTYDITSKPPGTIEWERSGDSPRPSPTHKRSHPY